MVSDIKSIICFLAARRIGYSGEIIAKALGITRSGVCRGASRGAALVAQNQGKWGCVEDLINKSTTSPYPTLNPVFFNTGFQRPSKFWKRLPPLCFCA